MDNIEWVPTNQINQGNPYKPSDGVTADDMNKIIQNMKYLRMNAGEVNIVFTGARVENNTLYLSTGGV